MSKNVKVIGLLILAGMVMTGLTKGCGGTENKASAESGPATVATPTPAPVVRTTTTPTGRSVAALEEENRRLRAELAAKTMPEKKHLRPTIQIKDDIRQLRGQIRDLEEKLGIAREMARKNNSNPSTNISQRARFESMEDKIDYLNEQMNGLVAELAEASLTATPAPVSTPTPAPEITPMPILIPTAEPATKPASRPASTSAPTTEPVSRPAAMILR